MKYKFTSKVSIELDGVVFEAGTIFYAYVEWDYDNHRPYYNVCNCSKPEYLRQAVSISDDLLNDKKVFDKEIDRDDCWNLSCDVCGSCKPVSVTAEKYGNDIISVSCICSCGNHWGFMPTKHDKEMMNYEI